MGKRAVREQKTAAGYGVQRHGGGAEGHDACVKRREKLSEKITDLLGPVVEKIDDDCDVVVIVTNHTGTSVVGHAKTKWDVLRKAFADHDMAIGEDKAPH